ncbi:MAG: hypothetical protein WBF42_14630 [Terracidiphilus sp.]
MDDFEKQLQQAFVRRPAPPGLKRRLMDERQRRRTLRLHQRAVLWQRLAACLLIAVVLGGGIAWRQADQRRKGEEARRQVLTALRITNRTLNQMSARLAARSRADESKDDPQGEKE